MVAQRQDSVACYENANGSITIRRERDWDEDDDVIIVITKANVPAFVRAILRAAGSDLELVRSLGNGSYEDVHSDIDWRAANTDSHRFEAAEENAERRSLSTKVPKDPTAAERQRRSRASRKNGRGRDSDCDSRDGHANEREIDQHELMEAEFAHAS